MSITLDVKRKDGPATFVILAVMLGMAVYSLIYATHPVLIGIWWSLIGHSLVSFIFYLIKLSEPQPEVVLHEDYLVLNDIRMNAEEVGTIYTRGYFTTYIAIVPPGRRIASRRQCFRLGKQDLRDMKAIRAWAERNGVKMVTNKRIISWS